MSRKILAFMFAILIAFNLTALTHLHAEGGLADTIVDGLFSVTDDEMWDSILNSESSEAMEQNPLSAAWPPYMSFCAEAFAWEEVESCPDGGPSLDTCKDAVDNAEKQFSIQMCPPGYTRVNRNKPAWPTPPAGSWRNGFYVQKLEGSCIGDDEGGVAICSVRLCLVCRRNG